MPKYKVIIELDGQRLKKEFEWDGTEEELEATVRESIIIKVIK